MRLASGGWRGGTTDAHRWVLALYLGTLLVRLLNWRSVIYGDESWVYYASLHLGSHDGNIFVLGRDEPEHLRQLTWWRPFFVLALAPFAPFGFEAWRLGHILLTSWMPPVGFLAARAAGGRPWTARAAGLALLVQPLLQRWSVIGFMDALMTTLLVAALWRWLAGRPLEAAALLLLACWTKETALVAAAFFAAWGLGRAWAAWRGKRGWRALLPHLAPLPVLPLGAVPLWAYLQRGGLMPGWVLDGAPKDTLNLVLIPWLLGPLVLGLAWRRTRLLAAFPLAIVAFHYAYTRWGHHSVEPWYAVLPGALTLVAVPLVADEALQRAGRRPTRNVAARGFAAALSILLAVQAFVPDTVPVKQPLTRPSAQVGGQSLAQVVASENARDRHFGELQTWLGPPPWGKVLLVDLPWYYMYHPFADHATRVTWGVTRGADAGDGELWNRAVDASDITILDKAFQDAHGPRFEELRDRWAACVRFENDFFAAIRPATCN